MTIYNNHFYGDDSTRKLSAKKILGYYWKFFNPKKVVDVGCGRGAWLDECKRLGAIELLGVDGDYNSQYNMFKNFKYITHDLNKKLIIKRKYDLAISVETIEHLKPESTNNFIKSLCTLSETIIFSGAFPHQGGVGHINERLHSDFAKLFIKNNYFPFDFFRPTLFSDKSISFWYRQNIFLYVKKNSYDYKKLIRQNIEPLKDIYFMNCIHPELYLRKIYNNGIKESFKNLIKAIVKNL
jgi:cyclopropane fatty-acyl-phospholipid synthase-like methyltransferase